MARLADLVTFSEALFHLKKGRRVQRVGWNGKNMWLELQRPDAHSNLADGVLQRKMTLPYIVIKTADNQLVPWVAAQTDLLSDDWAVMTAL